VLTITTTATLTVPNYNGCFYSNVNQCLQHG